MEKKRIEWIDALRGFTMLLVVCYHVHTHCFGKAILDYSSVSDYFKLFRMPLFFAISGYFFYSPNKTWSLEETLSVLKKKAKIQIIPAFIFGYFFAFYTDKSFHTLICSYNKLGYWFTYALLVFFIIFSITELLSKLFNCKESLRLTFHALIASLLFIFVNKVYIFDGAWIHYLSISQFYYYIFFLTGTIIRSKENFFYNILDNSLARIIIIVYMLTVPIVIISKDISIPNTILDIAYTLISASLGICLAFMFFRHYQNQFTNNKPVGIYIAIYRTQNIRYLSASFLISTSFRFNQKSFIT
ncbi:MAG: acyltransferase family protein [Bacteroidaceae bacterium]|nr:acyltransferase family protein [Bacteroidaceae bacterium]